jgi:hypothetical protein
MGAGAPRGLQNRLRGAVEASWVGSIPIHPRQFWPVLTEMTAKIAGGSSRAFALIDYPRGFRLYMAETKVR